jgi:hypothetical protein
MAAVSEAFGQVSEVLLTRMCGLWLSESTVQRLAESVGEDVGERLSRCETFGEQQRWNWHKDAEGKACAYVSIDATGVPQQGPAGQSAEGRMATVAMVYNPIPEDRERWAKPNGRRPEWQARYLATLHGQASLADPARQQAAQVGMDRAECWIALSDGGAGLEDWLRVNFGRVDAVIIDFYHVSEHLGELAKAWHGVGTEAAKSQHAEWSHLLKHKGGEAILEVLRSLDPPRRQGLRQLWRETLNYIANHVHRMDYPNYRTRGWQIGSGPIESACKTVVGKRLKGSGMRWRERGADAMCHLRALFLSERTQWRGYWSQRARAA